MLGTYTTSPAIETTPVIQLDAAPQSEFVQPIHVLITPVGAVTTRQKPPSTTPICREVSLVFQIWSVGIVANKFTPVLIARLVVLNG